MSLEPDSQMSKTSRDRPHRPDPPPHRPGATTAVRDAVRAPRQPHEHDVSSHSQQGEPTDAMRRAQDDVARRLSDTRRGEASDVTYERNLRSLRPRMGMR